MVAEAKFTNVFRLLDRGSQYLLSLMDEPDPLERLAVSYLYRQINRPESMEDIITANGGYIPSFKEVISKEWLQEVLVPVARSRTGKFLNRAYTIFIIPGDSRRTPEKMLEVFPQAAGPLHRAAAEPSLEGRVRMLSTVPGLGPFMAMQIATDLGYGPGESDQENDFIVVGPGSRKGISYLTESNPEEYLHSFPASALPTLPGSNGRPPSLMDLQNLFCEFDKWVRYRQTGVWKPYKPSDRYFEVHIPDQFIW